MSYFTVDQAGKVENASNDTIIALCSEKIQYTIKLPKELKQDLFNQCNKRYKKQLTFRIFAFCLYLLLKDRIQKDSIIKIDDEYSKHDRDIKTIIIKSFTYQKRSNPV